MLTSNLRSNWNSEVIESNLEATMASEATRMTVRWIMHMDARVIEVAGFKFEVKLKLRPSRGHQSLYHAGIW